MWMWSRNMGNALKHRVGDNSTVGWWSLGPFYIRPDLQDFCAAEANFTACTTRGMSPVSAYVPGTQEMSWLDQKAISLLNANLFVCPFFPPLCVRLDCTSGRIMTDYGRRGTLCFLQKQKKKIWWCWGVLQQLFSGWGCKSRRGTGQEPAFGVPEWHNLIRFIFHFMAADILAVYKLW